MCKSYSKADKLNSSRTPQDLKKYTTAINIFPLFSYLVCACRSLLMFLGNPPPPNMSPAPSCCGDVLL